MITLTEKAVKAVSRFIRSAETPATGLRVSVAGGGCSGLQYGMKLENEAAADDTVLEFGPVKVFVDPASAPMLNGVTVDFIDTMTESGFKFINPNAANSCGCGKSFSC
jgi:iron-sulfur cluster assembly accessory protein